jgi:hypothetical protein
MRVRDIESVGEYDCLYVGSTAESVLLSCSGRLMSEQRQGLRALVVALHDEPSSEEVESALGDVGADYLVAGVPRRELPRDGCALIEPGPEDGERRAQIGELLADLRYRTRALHAYLPLGAGGHVDHRIALDAGVDVFEERAPHDVFLYEERPQLFAPAAVRIRLGQLGARLPPGAARVRARGGLLWFLLRFGFGRHVRRELGSLGYLRRVQVAVREWSAATQWQPQKALGLRLHPVIQAAPLEDFHAALATMPSGIETSYGSEARAVREALGYARWLGRPGEYVERYWLLLPPREEGGLRTIAPSASSAA